MYQKHYLVRVDASFIGSNLIQITLNEGQLTTFLMDIIYNAILNCYQRQSKQLRKR